MDCLWTRDRMVRRCRYVLLLSAENDVHQQHASLRGMFSLVHISNGRQSGLHLRHESRPMDYLFLFINTGHKSGSDRCASHI